jgi:hypothetical protein
MNFGTHLQLLKISNIFKSSHLFRIILKAIENAGGYLAGWYTFGSYISIIVNT